MPQLDFIVAHFIWRPGIGDPTIGGWLTVALYFLAAISCRITARDIARGSRERRIWLAIAILFLALGVNKQLDLQSALTEAARLLAEAQGWYARRRPVQVEFILAVAAACLLAALVLLVWARRSPLPTWVALLGVVLVLGFVTMRAASFHHFDRFIRTSIFGMRWNWIIEMAGIGIVLLASAWRRHRATSEVRTAR